ncbi:facilitated trehalose transporter Tret1-like [Coccinella septempunctata]|uniref:facilitated trehalose transporter Tret1-like n=1 Tax=Coccinella septempunctata TaxID=41139 RepID=UPI001D067137|nr:facilitated trehalose transporter Tret1-like [Coccinella septempunctata]
MKTWMYFADLFGSKYAFCAAIVGDILCLFTGMSIAWSSPVLVKLNGTDDNPLGNPITGEENDWIGSVFSIGGAIGPIIFIYTLELLGRKATMLILAVIFPVFHFILAFSTNIYLYYACRIAIGAAVGGSFSIVAVYVSEIVSAKMRGTYLSLGTSFILSGCLISYSVGPNVSIRTFNLIIAVSSLAYIPFFVLICPESLYYTMQKYGPEKTMTLLQRLRNSSDVNVELEEIEITVGNEERGSLLDVFRNKAASKAFFICTVLLILQQFCGVNVIMTYTENIFKDAKVSMAPDVCTIVVSAIQTATCLITPIASRRFNRKLLLTFSFVGVSLSNILLGLYFAVDAIGGVHWLPLAALVSFFVFYNCGVGPLPWATLGELYPQNVKSVGTATSNTIYWLFQFLLTYYFNKVDEGLAFLIFGGLCLVAAVFVQFFLIETRGKTLQEIQRELTS